MDPSLILIAAVLTYNQVASSLKGVMTEPEQQKQARLLYALYQRQCPRSEEDKKNTSFAITQMGDNQYSQELIGVFRQCMQKEAKDFPKKG